MTAFNSKFTITNRMTAAIKQIERAHGFLEAARLSVLNYRSAFEFVSECLDSGDPITEGLIREIHRKLVEGVRGEKADPGNYRRSQNYIANSCLVKQTNNKPSAG